MLMTYWFKKANKYRITMTTDRGRLCKNLRMPWTSSCLESNSVEINEKQFISYVRKFAISIVINVEILTSQCYKVIEIDDREQRFTQFAQI